MSKTTLYLDGIDQFSRVKGIYSIKVTDRVMDDVLFLLDKGYKILYVKSFNFDDYICVTRPGKENKVIAVGIGAPFSRWVLLEYKKLKRKEND